MPMSGVPGQHARLSATRAMPATRVTITAMPVSSAPRSKCPTNDGTISNAIPVAASPTAARTSTLFIARANPSSTSLRGTADPALLLEARLQLRADLLGNLLDAALDRVAAAQLAVRLHARRQDEARRVFRDRPGCDAHRHPRRLVAGRGYIAGAELAQ